LSTALMPTRKDCPTGSPFACRIVSAERCGGRSADRRSVLGRQAESRPEFFVAPGLVGVWRILRPLITSR
jgi:hypothetical protein